MCEHKNIVYAQVETVEYARTATVVDGVLCADTHENPHNDSGGSMIDHYFECYDCGQRWDAQDIPETGGIVKVEVESWVRR